MVTDSSPRLADATDTTKRRGRAAQKHMQQQLVGKRGQHGVDALSLDGSCESVVLWNLEKEKITGVLSDPQSRPRRSPYHSPNSDATAVGASGSDARDVVRPAGSSIDVICRYKAKDGAGWHLGEPENAFIEAGGQLD